MSDDRGVCHLCDRPRAPLNDPRAVGRCPQSGGPNCANLRARVVHQRRELKAKNVEVVKLHRDQGDLWRRLREQERRAEQAEQERDEARAQLAEVRSENEALSRQLASRTEMLTVANTTTRELRERAEQAEQLCTERGEQVARLMGALRDMQVRAETAEARVLSDETVRTVREHLSYMSDTASRDALAELDAKYPESPDGCRSGDA